jgi:hypothetical protein
MSLLRVHAPAEPSAALLGWGTARADLTTIAAMRKKIPAWAPQDTPGHFFKHADEQTVLAVAALDQAICSAGIASNHYRDWMIIAAPCFIGRLAGTVTLDRFVRGGGPAISPHTIPQHSLHSVSGVLSILLASHRPSFGVGGTADSLAEGLLASLTFPTTNCPGIWLVATAWNPEPRVDEKVKCVNEPVCHAVALALELKTGGQSCGRLRLARDSVESDLANLQWSFSAAELAESLSARTPGGASKAFAWRLAWGATLVLEAREPLAGLAAA